MDHQTREDPVLNNIIGDLNPGPIQIINQESDWEDPEFLKVQENEHLKRKAEKDASDLKQALDQQEEKEQESNKRIKYDENELRIPRKTSDDLIKIFEQLPEHRMIDLLEQIKSMKTPDLKVKLDMSRFFPSDGFSLNDHSSGDDQNKKGSGKKRPEKECTCCSQVVKRHICKHLTCEKPCIKQEKQNKQKQKN